MRARLTPALLVLALAACSSGGGGDTASSSPSPAVDYTSARSIASALDARGFPCIGYEQNTDVIAVKEDGFCDHLGTTISVTIYQSSESLDQLVEAFGGLASGWAVRGDPAWMVHGMTDRGQAEQVAKLIGGKIQQ